MSLFSNPVQYMLRHGGEGSNKQGTGLQQQWQGLTGAGFDANAYGDTLTKEGLGDLRSQYGTYQDRLKDPLGATGRGIFERARGALSDDAVRRQRANQARVFQLALQNGGTMSPEAQAELQTRNQRDINESLFSAKSDLANQEASLTLSETSKLFDRMDSIAKTITGVGQDEKTRGLQTIIQALIGRGKLMNINMGPYGKAGVGS